MVRTDDPYPTHATGRRRRGAVLEDAVLQGAWAQLVEGGYERFTFDAVAARARASKSVLYRRWTDRLVLADAAASHHVRQLSCHAPATGRLRDDLLALLTCEAERRREFVVIASLEIIRGRDQRTAKTPLDYVASRSSEMLDAVYVQAVTRGELPAECLKLPWRSVPLKLIWAEIFQRAPITSDAIVRIVDDVVLPLLAHASC